MFTYFVLKGVYCLLTNHSSDVFILLKEDVPKKINKPIFVVQSEPTNSLCFQTNANKRYYDCKNGRNISNNLYKRYYMSLIESNNPIW